MYQQKAQEEVRVQAQPNSSDMSKTRIQFKLPLGNHIIGTFDATTAFGNLRPYVIQNAQLSSKHFSMSTIFPKRDFTSVDDNKTLSELELVPSAVILIRPLTVSYEMFS